jgi:hypothetical protein
MKSLFKKAAGVAVLISPFLLSSGIAQAAEDKVPDDSRYAKLTQAYKNPRKDCVFLDRQDETKNKASDTIRKMLEIVQRIPEGRDIVKVARDGGLGMCMVSEQEVSDQFRTLGGHYNKPLGIIALDRNLDFPEMVSDVLHEGRHMEDLKDKPVNGNTTGEVKFNDANKAVVSIETSGYAGQFLNTWKLSKKEFTAPASPYNSARLQITGVFRRNGQPEIPWQPTPTEAIATAVMDMLDRLYKTSPEAIDDGRAEQAVRDLIAETKYVENSYSPMLIRNEVFTLAANMALLGRDNPELFLQEPGHLEQMIGEFMEDRGIIADKTVERSIAHDVVDSSKDMALSFGAKEPKKVASGDAANAIYEHFKSLKLIDSICDRVMQARKFKFQSPANSQP